MTIRSQDFRGQGVDEMIAKQTREYLENKYRDEESYDENEEEKEGMENEKV